MRIRANEWDFRKEQARYDIPPRCKISVNWRSARAVVELLVGKNAFVVSTDASGSRNFTCEGFDALRIRGKDIASGCVIDGNTRADAADGAPVMLGMLPTFDPMSGLVKQLLDERLGTSDKGLPEDLDFDDEDQEASDFGEGAMEKESIYEREQRLFGEWLAAGGAQAQEGFDKGASRKDSNAGRQSTGAGKGDGQASGKKDGTKEGG